MEHAMIGGHDVLRMSRRSGRIVITMMGALLLSTALTASAHSTSSSTHTATDRVAADYDFFSATCYRSDTFCQNGSTYRGNLTPGGVPVGFSFCWGPGRDGEYQICIKRGGDITYVNDKGYDGRSAVTVLERAGGGGYRRICRDANGSGQRYPWVRCNWDWDEGTRWGAWGYEFNKQTDTFVTSTQSWRGFDD